VAETFQGPVRVYGGDGILLTTGSADLVTDHDMGNWKGRLTTLNGTGVAGKALIVELEIPGDGRARAQLTPESVGGGMAISSVVGLSPQPF
jgi:hypothetical protein